MSVNAAVANRPPQAEQPFKTLFLPYRLGNIELNNRLVMAPMTRSRAVERNVPNPIAATYYAQRASAGLIVTEATQVSPQGVGYIRTPGIHSAEQVAGWTRITEAVHHADGKIFAQLWHVGRISHPDFHSGELPVAPSAIAAQREVITAKGPQQMVTPRALAQHLQSRLPCGSTRWRAAPDPERVLTRRGWDPPPLGKRDDVQAWRQQLPRPGLDNLRRSRFDARGTRRQRRLPRPAVLGSPVPFRRPGNEGRSQRTPVCAETPRQIGDVRFGSFSDIAAWPCRVRPTPESRR
jgi:hypothetical protein